MCTSFFKQFILLKIIDFSHSCNDYNRISWTLKCDSVSSNSLKWRWSSSRQSEGTLTYKKEKHFGGISQRLRESTVFSWEFLSFLSIKAQSFVENDFEMAAPGSPSSFNGYEEDPIFQKSHYTQDISEQMRVPKRIKATGEYYDDFDLPLGNGTSNWGYQDKIDMTVPDRIMVIGQEQHLGKF